MATTQDDIVKAFDAAPGTGTIKNIGGHDVLVVKDADGNVVFACVHDRTAADGYAVRSHAGAVDISRDDKLSGGLKTAIAAAK